MVEIFIWIYVTSFIYVYYYCYYYIYMYILNNDVWIEPNIKNMIIKMI